MFDSIWNVIAGSYITSPVWLKLSILAVVYLVIRAGRPARKKILLCTLFAILVVLNDLSYRFLVNIMDVASYYRFLWVFPYGMIVAYAIMQLYVDFKNTIEEREGGKRLVLSGAVLLFGIVFVMFFYTQGNYISRLKNERPSNEYLVYEDVLDAKKIIDSERQKGMIADTPVIAGPYIIMLQYQTIDADCVMPTDRIVYLQIRTQGWDVNQAGPDYQDRLLLSTICENNAQPDVRDARGAVDRLGVDYMMVHVGTQMEEYMESLGCTLVDQTASLLVYRVE